MENTYKIHDAFFPENSEEEYSVLPTTVDTFLSMFYPVLAR